MSSSAPCTPLAMSVASPLKARATPTPFEVWALKTLDPVVGVPTASFNFPPNGPPKGCRILLLGVITTGKHGESASAQGLDLRQREGAIALLKGVFQLTPTTLVKSSNRHWIFEVPIDFEYDKLRGGVFGLSQTVGFVLLRPDAALLRTVEGFIPNYWSQDVEPVRAHVLGVDMVESVVELKRDVVSV